MVAETDRRPPPGLVVAPRPAPAVEDTEAWRPGRGGGPIEFRVVLVEGVRPLAAAPPRALAGVPVREVEALEFAVERPSCFVGDLVGDYYFHV